MLSSTSPAAALSLVHRSTHTLSSFAPLKRYHPIRDTTGSTQAKPAAQSTNPTKEESHQAPGRGAGTTGSTGTAAPCPFPRKPAGRDIGFLVSSLSIRLSCLALPGARTHVCGIHRLLEIEATEDPLEIQY